MWFAGARPRTLPAAIVPVAVGTAVGYLYSGRLVYSPSATCHTVACHLSLDHQLSWPNALLALVVALAIQIGTNYVNDYADGERGTDESRVGPLRLVAGGLATVRQVKLAAAAAFGVAAIAGLILAARVTWWLVPLGAVCFVAGWAYTGGPKPYGYYGFGELFVFVFFGLVATVGSAYVQTAHIHQLDVVAAVPVGLLAVALLVVNNLRDIPGDTVAAKRTLAVRLGDRLTRALYVGCLVVAFAALAYVGALRVGGLLALAAVPLAVVPIRRVRGGASGPALIAVLGATGRLQLAFGACLTVGLLLG